MMEMGRILRTQENSLSSRRLPIKVVLLHLPERVAVP
jgi:hypothetical protein